MLQAEVTHGEPRQKKKFHFAFVVAIAGLLTQFVLLCCQRMPALSLEMIRESMNLDYTQVGLITSWFTIFYAGAAFVWGWMTDKIGAKFTLVIAETIAAIGLILFGTIGAQSYYIAVAVWCVAGFGCAGLYMATIPKLVASWFAPDKRGFAMSLITPGGTICSIVLGIVIPPLLVSSGWQTGFIACGVFCAVVALFTFFLVKEKPSDIGLAPYGVPAGTQVAPAPKVEEEHAVAQKQEKASKGSFIQCLKMPITWHYGIMQIFYQIGYMVSTTYYVASVTFAGYDTVQAGLSITWGGIACIILIQLWGNLSDRIERKYVIMIGCAASAIVAGVYCFVLQGQPALALCYFFVAALTATNGITPVLLALAGDYYPQKYRGTGTGIISTLTIIGRYAGPWIAGMVIDASMGNIGYGFLVVTVSMVIGAVIALTLPKVKNSATASS